MIKRNLSEQDRTKDEENNRRLNETIHKFFRNHYNAMDAMSRPSIPALQKQLLEMDGGMFFSTNTISDALSNTGKSAISMNLVVALCRLWQLDIRDVFAEVFAGYKIQPAFDTVIHGAKFLTNPGYQHTFYGYLYPNNVKDYHIQEFQLDITRQDGISKAVMVKYYAQEDRTSTYQGVPVVLDRDRLILLVLTREDGRSCILIFEYRELDSRGVGLYFRNGMAISIEANSEKPILRNFVMFREPLTEEKKEYLPGLLRLQNDTMLIKRDMLERLRENEEMAAFFSDYEYNWNTPNRNFLTIRFSQVLSAIEDQHDPERNQAETFRVMRALLTLSEMAESPIRFVYDNKNEVVEFARYFMQGQDSEEAP